MASPHEYQLAPGKDNQDPTFEGQFNWTLPLDFVLDQRMDSTTNLPGTYGNGFESFDLNNFAASSSLYSFGDFTNPTQNPFFHQDTIDPAVLSQRNWPNSETASSSSSSDGHSSGFEKHSSASSLGTYSMNSSLYSQAQGDSLNTSKPNKRRFCEQTIENPAPAEPQIQLVYPENILSMEADQNAISIFESWLSDCPSIYPEDSEFNDLAALTRLDVGVVKSWFVRRLRAHCMDDSTFENWLQKYPSVYPGEKEFRSWAGLTKLSLDAVRLWFAQKLRCTSSSMPRGNEYFMGETQAIEASSSTPIASTSQQPTILQRATAWVREEKETKCKATLDFNLLLRDNNKPFQCTLKCGKKFRTRDDWKRHEEVNWPQEGWVCDLPASAVVAGIQICTQCETPNPQTEHVETHKKAACSDQPFPRGRLFHRKDHFSQHFRKVHPHLPWVDYERSSHFLVESNFPRRCGFCSHRFLHWKDRVEHIGFHFHDEGEDMTKWNDQSKGEDENDNSDDKQDDEDDRSPDDGSDSDDDDSDDLPPRSVPKIRVQTKNSRSGGQPSAAAVDSTKWMLQTGLDQIKPNVQPSATILAEDDPDDVSKDVAPQSFDKRERSQYVRSDSTRTTLVEECEVHEVSFHSKHSDEINKLQISRGSAVFTTQGIFQSTIAMIAAMIALLVTSFFTEFILLGTTISTWFDEQVAKICRVILAFAIPACILLSYRLTVFEAPLNTSTLSKASKSTLPWWPVRDLKQSTNLKMVQIMRHIRSLLFPKSLFIALLPLIIIYITQAATHAPLVIKLPSIIPQSSTLPITASSLGAAEVLIGTYFSMAASGIPQTKVVHTDLGGEICIRTRTETDLHGVQCLAGANPRADTPFAVVDWVGGQSVYFVTADNYLSGIDYISLNGTWTFSPVRAMNKAAHPKSKLSSVSWFNGTSTWLYYQDANNQLREFSVDEYRDIAWRDGSIEPLGLALAGEVNRTSPWWRQADDNEALEIHFQVSNATLHGGAYMEVAWFSFTENISTIGSFPMMKRARWRRVAEHIALPGSTESDIMQSDLWNLWNDHFQTISMQYYSALAILKNIRHSLDKIGSNISLLDAAVRRLYQPMVFGPNMMDTGKDTAITPLFHDDVTQDVSMQSKATGSVLPRHPAWLPDSYQEDMRVSRLMYVDQIPRQTNWRLEDTSVDRIYSITLSICIFFIVFSQTLLATNTPSVLVGATPSLHRRQKFHGLKFMVSILATLICVSALLDLDRKNIESRAIPGCIFFIVVQLLVAAVDSPRNQRRYKSSLIIVASSTSAVLCSTDTIFQWSLPLVAWVLPALAFYLKMPRTNNLSWSSIIFQDYNKRETASPPSWTIILNYCQALLHVLGDPIDSLWSLAHHAWIHSSLEAIYAPSQARRDAPLYLTDTHHKLWILKDLEKVERHLTGTSAHDPQILSMISPAEAILNSFFLGRRISWFLRLICRDFIDFASWGFDSIIRPSTRILKRSVEILVCSHFSPIRCYFSITCPILSILSQIGGIFLASRLRQGCEKLPGSRTGRYPDSGPRLVLWLPITSLISNMQFPHIRIGRISLQDASLLFSAMTISVFSIGRDSLLSAIPSLVLATIGGLLAVIVWRVGRVCVKSMGGHHQHLESSAEDGSPLETKTVPVDADITGSSWREVDFGQKERAGRRSSKVMQSSGGDVRVVSWNIDPVADVGAWAEETTIADEYPSTLSGVDLSMDPSCQN